MDSIKKGGISSEPGKLRTWTVSTLNPIADGNVSTLTSNSEHDYFNVLGIVDTTSPICMSSDDGLESRSAKPTHL